VLARLRARACAGDDPRLPSVVQEIGVLSLEVHVRGERFRARFRRDRLRPANPRLTGSVIAEGTGSRVVARIGVPLLRLVALLLWLEFALLFAWAALSDSAWGAAYTFPVLAAVTAASVLPLLNRRPERLQREALLSILHDAVGIAEGSSARRPPPVGA
jgi:hypothetical protein